MHTLGELLPVLVTSRGMKSESYAHYPCFLAWKAISDVQYDTTRAQITNIKKKRVYVRPKQRHDFAAIQKGNVPNNRLNRIYYSARIKQEYIQTADLYE